MNSSVSEIEQISQATSPLARELWISLASLLRAHLWMRSLAKPAADLGIIESSDTELDLKSRHRRLCITAPAVSQRGSIRMIDLDGSSGADLAEFWFAQDGLLYFEDCGGTSTPAGGETKGMELETAVEYLLDRICTEGVSE